MVGRAATEMEAVIVLALARPEAATKIANIAPSISERTVRQSRKGVRSTPQIVGLAMSNAPQEGKKVELDVELQQTGRNPATESSNAWVRAIEIKKTAQSASPHTKPDRRWVRSTP